MIRIVHTGRELRALATAARAEEGSIGFVPTMGALHQGHVALMEQARRECSLVVVSIFVNPTQFGPSEDFGRYPRTWDQDLACCQAAGVDVLFAPSVEEMYPHGLESTVVEPGELAREFEGAMRPGHFRGVATVVLKLLQLAMPDRAYFGQKDYQQLLVVKRMVEDLLLPVEIRAHPTVREADGLALSSRNRYLTAEERHRSGVVYRALRRAHEAVLGGLEDADRVRQILRETIESERGVVVEYAEVADRETLARLAKVGSGRAVALVAARVGSTRLIDNILL